MAISDSTVGPKFFSNLTRFIRHNAPGALTPAQLSRMESGHLLHGESRRVSRLSALADQWQAACEALRKCAHKGNAMADEARLEAEAWVLLRIVREDLRTPEDHERMDALRALSREWHGRHHLGEAHPRVIEAGSALRAKLLEPAHP